MVMICFSLHHKGLNVPVRIPFRRLGALCGEDIMSMVEKVHQSNDNAMDIGFLHVEDPGRHGEGRGHRSKHSPKLRIPFDTICKEWDTRRTGGSEIGIEPRPCTGRNTLECF